MPSLIKSKRVTARKPHTCRTCGCVAVERGEQYQRDTYTYDGSVYDWITCRACSQITQAVYEWNGRPDEGVGTECFVEWAGEYRDDLNHGESARAFLARLEADNG